MGMRPVGYVIGLLIAALGLTMIAPALIDAYSHPPDWRAFAASAALTTAIGVGLSIASKHDLSDGMTLQQAFVMTVAAWLVLPIFGSLPFMFGALDITFTDAFFEVMSGITTTGSTVLSGLDQMPPGVLLWRALLQWFGGIGIIVFAVAFLPSLKVGGMQLFKSESFDTFGKILPRAAEIAASISWIYFGITLLCALAYGWAGMNGFDAITHAMTTIATGGFANYDGSFGAFGQHAQYVAVFFMLVASLPFIRYVQMTRGSSQPLFQDSQVRAFLGTVIVVVLILTLTLTQQNDDFTETGLRAAMFNAVSILTGTGYASADYMLWGGFAVAVFFIIGLIGGCAGSTTCSVKIFRYQVLFAAMVTRIRQLHSPRGVFTPRFQGRPISDEVIASVTSFLFLFVLSLGLIAMMLSFIGLDPMTAISSAATALANVGPGLGPIVGPSGNFQTLPDSAKWVLSAAMLLGRLELMSVLVLLNFSFWRK